MSRTYYGQPIGPSDPSGDIAEVTPSDTVDLPDGRCIYLYVGTAGDVAVVTEEGGEAHVFKNVPNGCYLWVRGLRVNSTGTTATDILAHY